MKSSHKTNAALLGAALTAVTSIWSLKPSLVQAATSTNTAGPVQQGQSDGGSGNPALNNPAVTITFAGQTALKAYFASGALTELQSGTSIILHDGTPTALYPYGSPILYNAPAGSSTSVQLASNNFTIADTGSYGSVHQKDSAIRLEWHGEGSVDGFVDLLNDQVGYNQSSGPIANETLRAPSSANPTYVNSVAYTAYNYSGSSPANANGLAIAPSYLNGINGSTGLSYTYNTNVYQQSTGTNLQGGQNRVQFSIGEFPTEGLAYSGTASPFASAGSAGYGLGNPALTPVLTGTSKVTALGTAGARQQFQPVSSANESTSLIDPSTGSAYPTGPWNTAGTANITSTPFAVTAVTYSANPGTGLQRIDLGDAQWLQTTGRLQNGALFNVVARTVNTGQRVVFALATGVDPSWAVGSNDDGNSTSTANANAQHAIGPSLRFDGKTAGSEAETTIAASRMALGALSVPEARAAASNAPVAALDVDFTDQSDVNTADDANPTSNGKFVRATYDTIVSDGINPIEDGGSYNGTVVSHYAATLISHVNTVKAPNPTFATASATAWANASSFDPATAELDGTNYNYNSSSSTNFTGIQGDPTGDVAAIISNLVNSNGTAAAGLNLSNASINNPADGLFGQGYLIPSLLNYTRTADGNPITPVTLSANALAEQNTVQQNYSGLFSTDQSAGANANTIGASSYYGATSNGLTTNNGSSGAAINGAIPITSNNYLFGNFNQNGIRDLSAVEQAVNAALSLYAVDGAKNSIFTQDGGVSNTTVIPSLNGSSGWSSAGLTKGDLIVLGDYNGDGRFDGADLYLLAIGASLTNNGSLTTLTATGTSTAFSDIVRDPNAVLRKNAALSYINSYLGNYAAYNASAAGVAFIRNSAAGILTVPGITTAGAVPRNATALNTTDPVTGYEQFTYDPTGQNAFNPADVNRDGVVDFNDAILVDQYKGQSYQNLNQSLAATAQTPVSGLIEPISLVVVQQVDGEAAIGTADLTAINANLTGPGATNWYGYTVTKTQSGTISWNRNGSSSVSPVTVYSGAALQISSGSIHVTSAIDPFTDSTAANNSTGSSVAITVTSGGELEYTGQATSGVQLDRLASLNIASGGVVALDPYTTGHRSVLLTGGLTIATGGKLDLGNNDLDVQGGSLSTLNAAATSGFAAGTWNGTTGLTSTSAHGNTSHLTALGVIQNNQSGTALFTAFNTFDGVTPGVADVLAKYTYYGDTNLDGKVDGTDYSRIDNAYEYNLSHPGAPLTGWFNGDLNYDGSVNGNDYTLIDNAFNSQGAAFTSAIANPSVTIAAEIAPASGTSSVPEPTTLSFLTIAAAGALGRRRRR